jgi:hypothetical protein
LDKSFLATKHKGIRKWRARNATVAPQYSRYRCAGKLIKAGEATFGDRLWTVARPSEFPQDACVFRKRLTVYSALHPARFLPADP